MEKSYLSQRTSRFWSSAHVRFDHHYRDSSERSSFEQYSQNLVFGFSGAGPELSLHSIETGMPVIGERALQELWCWRSRPQAGQRGDMHWWSGEGFALICCCLPSSDKTLLEDTESLYKNIFSQALELGCGYPLRVWNYIPHINRGDGDSENYKKFCAGRKIAFDQCDLSCDAYPAASALGHKHDSILVYGLFAATPGVHFENPDQISAYRYPRQYGPKSPSFARATLVNFQDSQRLYFSGTASVIGHQTQHLNDVRAQTRTTLQNLSKLFEHVKTEGRLARLPNAEMLKVYLRSRSDMQYVRELIQMSHPEAQILYVEADICRADLLIEIDGHCGL